jgi:carboxymethylenebutenolidase
MAPTDPHAAEGATAAERPAETAIDRTRRDFVRAAVGSGFAAAVLPVAAETVHTPSTGLDAGEITVPVGDFRLPVYRAMPAMASTSKGVARGLPVVLVLSEIFGVHEHIADVARRFAQRGYLALAPELFVRQGDAQGYGEVSKLIDEVISKVPDAQVMADLDACLAWAGAQGGDLSRVAVTGFCWGGRISWLYAAHQPAVKAAVAWYGQLLGTPSAWKPTNPIDVVERLRAPVLGLYGEKDTGIPLDAVERMKKALAAASNPAAQRSEFVVYPDAPHAFHADYRPSYRQAAAEDGWQRCLAWFGANGVA